MMNSGLKNITGIFLFLCLTAPFIGTFGWLKFEKYKTKKSIKWRMIEGMDKAELVLLKFTKEESETELEWEHSKEFEYAGQMYDVVEKAVKGDTTFYWCWWDHEETKLNKQLGSLVERAMGQNPRNKENQNRLHNFLKTLYHQTTINSNSFLDLENKFYYATSVFNYNSIFSSPPAPPPEIV